MSKTENTNENKARFFAQYLGQQVCYPDVSGKLITGMLHGVTFSEIETNWKRKKNGCSGDILSFENNGHHKSDALNAFLELRDLSNITDEEAIAVAGEGFGLFKYCATPDTEILVVRELDKISVAMVLLDGKTCIAKIEVNNVWKLNIQQIDYLRSRGFALPWMDLSVDDLQNYGWIKIK
jgi:hypothetical protein